MVNIMIRSALFYTIVSVIWLLFLALSEFVINESTSFTTLITYCPQHLFIIPMVVAFFVALSQKQWLHLIINAALAFVFVYYFMGYGFGSSQPIKPDFNVMTLNVKRSKGDTDKIIGMINNISPDFLLLQEAVPLEERIDIPSTLIGYKNIMETGWQGVRIADVALLTKHRITDWRVYQPIQGVDRQFLIVDAIVNKKKVTAACVHFATKIPGESDSNGKSRVLQAEKLVECLPGANTVFGGDFNIPPRGSAYSTLAKNFQDAAITAQGTGYTYPELIPIMRLDHIFSSHDIIPVSWRRVKTGGSDHCAVVAEFAFSR